MKKLMIGGQALRKLGHTRHTEDVDYLVKFDSTSQPFITSDNVDYINANGNEFFAKVWKMEADNNESIASIQALAELKAYAFVQHCQNFNFKKADDCEFDLKFLVRQGFKSLKIANKYMTEGQHNEVINIIKSVKK